VYDDPMQPELSVIIPSYNEMKNLKRGVLEEVLSYLEKSPKSWELILSDDGSNDGTKEELLEFAKKDQRIRVLTNSHVGKAGVVSAGMLAANGEWRLFTDFDQSTPLPELDNLFRFANEGFDVVIGSREIAGAKRDDEPFYRHAMGKVFNMFVQLLAVPGIYDTQCCFKLFSKKAALELFSKLYVYGSQQERLDAYTGAFDVELLFLANKFGYKVKEVPIVWSHAESDRVSPIKDSLRMFRDILRIRLAEILGKY